MSFLNRPSSRQCLVSALCIIVALVLSIEPVAAQTQYSNGFRAGFEAGFNGSQVDGDGFNGYTKLGIHAGVLAELPIAKLWSASIEINYDQKGSKTDYKFNTIFPDSSFLYRLNYIELPFMLHYYYKPRVILGFGAEYGRLLNVREFIGTYEQFNIQGNQLTARGTATYPITNYDLSRIGQAQYILADNWVADARFSYSIVPFASSIRSRFAHHGQFHNLVTFSLIYMIGKPHKYG